MANSYTEIDEVIAYIHLHIDEPLELSQLAAHIAYSPYHFIRIFKKRMGISPLYYVSALRLQKAKDMLLHTDMSIRDIGLEIGQQSLGTFTTRFTERVGVTPTEFRNSTMKAEQFLHTLRTLNKSPSSLPYMNQHSTIEGTVQAEIPFEGVILIGLFARPIPEGLPLYGTLISSLGRFCMTGVKPGTYYLMATSISWGTQSKELLLPYATLRTRSREPIQVMPYSVVPEQQVMLYTPRQDDPPILISLSLLMDKFLNRVTTVSAQSSKI